MGNLREEKECFLHKGTTQTEYFNIFFRFQEWKTFVRLTMGTFSTDANMDSDRNKHLTTRPRRVKTYMVELTHGFSRPGVVWKNTVFINKDKDGLVKKMLGEWNFWLTRPAV